MIYWKNIIIVRCMVRGSFTFRVREIRVEVRYRCVMKVGTYKQGCKSGFAKKSEN